MKRILIVLIALSGILISAEAQKNPVQRNNRDRIERQRNPQEMRRIHQMEIRRHHQRAMMALNLTPAQKDQAKLYRETYKKKLIELNKNENITVKELRDRKYQLNKELQSKMKGLLTAEQKTKLQQLKNEDKIKAEAHFAIKLERMKTKLSLTDAQVAQMKAQREGTIAKLKAIQGNENLSRTERKEKLMSLKAEAKEQRTKIFTEEQLKKMKEMKEHHGDKDAAK
jgi:hypothetical protein